MQLTEQLDKIIQKRLKLTYLLYLPKDYDDQKKWPLMLFLHGMGERGNNIEDVKKHGIPYELEQGRELPCIVVSPQCPDGEFWLTIPETIYGLLSDIKERYPIDEERIYLTGMSMGGFGTWDMARRYPEEFAAILPICGGMMEPNKVVALQDMPIWTFHGKLDHIVPFEGTQQLVNLLQEAGSDVKFTVYEDIKHRSWVPAYANDEVYQWLLSKKRLSKKTH